MSTLKNSYVYSINGLFLKRNSLSPTILEDIDEFISIAPTIAENARTSLFERNNINWFIQHMIMIQSLLESVSAKFLLTEAEGILACAKLNHMDLCKKKIDPFISDFLSLSIEMQMAQKRAAQEQCQHKKGMLEAYKDTVNVLTASLHLLSANEYEKARDLLIDIEYPGDAAVINELMQSLSENDSAMVVHKVNQLKYMYMAQIDALDSFKGDNKKEILAVDDRADILRMVAGVLRERYKIMTATDGIAALKILEKKKPDLILLDIDMPVMNGFELARAIRQRSDFVNTPILFLTSNSTRDYVLKAIESGGNDFIVKPANRETLWTKVGRHI